MPNSNNRLQTYFATVFVNFIKLNYDSELSLRTQLLKGKYTIKNILQYWSKCNMIQIKEQIEM